MTDEAQTEAQTPARRRAAARVPGEAQTEAQAPARRRAAARVPGEAQTEAQAQGAGVATDAAAATTEEAPAAEPRFSIPDFRHKSASAAKAWFEANPQAPKRGVLTHEGWYVPEGAHAIGGPALR